MAQGFVCLAFAYKPRVGGCIEGSRLGFDHRGVAVDSTERRGAFTGQLVPSLCKWLDVSSEHRPADHLVHREKSTGWGHALGGGSNMCYQLVGPAVKHTRNDLSAAFGAGCAHATACADSMNQRGVFCLVPESPWRGSKQEHKDNARQNHNATLVRARSLPRRNRVMR